MQIESVLLELQLCRRRLRRERRRHHDSLPLALIQGLRLFRRYAYKALMLFERWLPNLMLYYCNTFFYYLAVLDLARCI